MEFLGAVARADLGERHRDGHKGPRKNKGLKVRLMKKGRIIQNRRGLGVPLPRPCSGQELMSMELYYAVLEGNTRAINDTYSDEYLLRTTPENNNIVHIAIRCDERPSQPMIIMPQNHEYMMTDWNRHRNFAQEALRRLPQLINGQNCDGNNPLHVAAEMGVTDFVEAYCDGSNNHIITPLEMRNSMGNTPLHVAIMYGNLDIATILVQVHPILVYLVNDLGEAPLHLAVKHLASADYENIVSLEEKRARRLLEEGSRDDRQNNQSRDRPRLSLGTPAKEMLALLLKTECYIACWRDANGMTPVHNAALLDTDYNLEVIRFIVERCPVSAEICDSSGMSVLHHLVNRITSRRDGLMIFGCQDIRALRNHQDQQGNTPLHMAVIDKDMVMVDLLLEFRVNVTIKNNQGFSAATLIQQSKILEQMMEKRVMTKDECHAAKEKGVAYLRERLESFGTYFLTSRDSEGRNFLHKLLLIEKTSVDMPEGFLGFLLSILRILPEISMDTDHAGDTPLHVLARNDPDVLMRIITTGITHVKDLNGEYEFYFDSLRLDVFLYSLYSAALMPNLKGNTPIHEAIMARNDQIWIKYGEAYREDDSTTILNAGVNKRKESVAHLLASRYPMPDSINEDVIRDLGKLADEGLYLLDNEGLSPTMRAFQAGNFEFAEKLYSIFPRTVEVQDPNGQTIWHQLVSLPPISYNIASSSFTKGVALCQLEKQDKGGNTPSHLAIEHRRFDLAELYLSQDGSKTADETPVFVTPLRDIRNKMGITPGDLIGSLTYLPPEFEEFIWKKSTMIGIRSMWGIPTTQMKDYVNAMGVIAALLTTITFTAVFTVPGGLNQEKGTPLLISMAAFQVFMISNVLAMCLSMMVLFCLLWIMATGNKSKSVVLLDFSILLLLASFYTTLVTFMTGLYATTYFVKPWIAIVALALCSMLLLLMHKYLVMKFVIPSGQYVLIFVDKASRYVHGLRRKFVSNVKKSFRRSSLTRSKSSANLPKSNSPSQAGANQPN